MCERHSGEWTSSKRSKVILPEPETEAEIFVHECDILSSRPDIDMQPSEHLSSVLKEESQNQTLPDLYEYRLQFGRHKGRTIPEIDLVDRGWLVWATKNLKKEPLLTMIKNYLEKEDDDI